MRRAAPLALPAVFVVVAAIVAAHHGTFTEYDGLMQLHAGRELAGTGVWSGWPSRFWPPLFGLLAAVLSPIAGGFWAGKMISLVSGVAALAAVWMLARELGAPKWAAALAQALVAANPLFFLNAVQAQNHMLDAALFVWALVFAARALRSRAPRHAVAAGVLAGLAGSTRYQSYVLFPVVAAALLLTRRDGREAIRTLAWFLVPAGIVLAPWLMQNWVRNGSPIATWQHLNIGSAFLDPDRSSGRWWWLLQARYHNVADVVRADPGAYVANVGRNALAALGHLFTSAAAAAALVPPALVLGGRQARAARRMLLASAAAFFLLVVQAFLRDYLFLAWACVVTALGADALALLARRDAGSAATKRAVAALGVALLASGVWLTSVRTLQWFDGFNRSATAHAGAVAAALRAHDPRIARKTIVAVHPIYADAAGARFASAPLYYKGSLEGFVTFGGLQPPVRAYVPRFPSGTPLRADYLVFNRALRNWVPQYGFLLDPTSGRVPATWTTVYRSGDVVVYEIR